MTKSLNTDLPVEKDAQGNIIVDLTGALPEDPDKARELLQSLKILLTDFSKEISETQLRDNDFKILTDYLLLTDRVQRFANLLTMEEKLKTCLESEKATLVKSLRGTKRAEVGRALHSSLDTDNTVRGLFSYMRLIVHGKENEFYIQNLIRICIMSSLTYKSFPYGSQNLRDFLITQNKMLSFEGAEKYAQENFNPNHNKPPILSYLQ